MSEKSLIRDANSEIIPQQYYDEASQTYKVPANGDTAGVDFSKKSLLRDANLEVVPSQYYDVTSGAFVIGTLPTGGGSGGTSFTGTISADDVTDTPNRVLVSPAQRTQIETNANDLTNQSQKITELQTAINNVAWDDLKDKPNSNVSSLDDAALKRHDHPNKTVLNKFSEDATGNVLYDGKSISSNNNGFTGTISADDVTDTTTRVLISPGERAQIGANTSDITSHSQRISELEDTLTNSSGTDEKVKTNANGVAGYLEDLIDGSTIVNENDKLKVPFIDTLTVTPQEINALTGVTANIQAQIDGLSNITNVREIVETEVDLPLPVPGPDITILVRQDSTQNGATTFYISNDTGWVYVNKIDSGLARNFTTNPIDLITETTSILPKARYEKQDAAETPFVDSDGNIKALNTQDALKELFQYAGNTKTAWASVVGLDLNKNNSAQEFSDVTYALKVRLANNLVGKGVNAHPSNRLRELIDKVPAIPNVSLAGGVKKITKLNVVAPYELRIPLNSSLSLNDITTTPIEFVPGDADVVHYQLDFNNGDESNFEANEFVEFDGVMKLKRNYELSFRKDLSWSDDGSLHRVLIEDGKWESIDKVDVSSGGTTEWKGVTGDSKVSVISPVFRSSGTLTQTGSNTNGYSMNQGRAVGSGVFYYEIKKTAGTTSNNRTGLVNTTGTFSYTSATYYSKHGTNIPSGTNIGILLDLRNPNGGMAKHTKDGKTWTAWTPIAGATGTTLKGTLYIATNNSASANTSTYKANVGNEEFQYAIPKEDLAQLREIYSFDGKKVYKMVNKTFVLNNGEYKFYDSAWQTVSTNLPTIEDFGLNGMDSLSPLLDRVDGVSPLDTLTGDLEFTTWSDDAEAFVVLEANALPYPQTIPPLSDIPLVGVDSIERFELTANDDVKVAVSFDSGVTLHAFKDGSWVIVDDVIEGMNAAEINGLTKEQIAQIRGNNDFIRFIYSLSNDAESDSMKIVVVLQGTERILPTDAYDLGYDAENKTIIYTLKRNMTLSVNYVDA